MERRLLFLGPSFQNDLRCRRELLNRLGGRSQLLTPSAVMRCGSNVLRTSRRGPVGQDVLARGSEQARVGHVFAARDARLGTAQVAVVFVVGGGGPVRTVLPFEACLANASSVGALPVRGAVVEAQLFVAGEARPAGLTQTRTIRGPAVWTGGWESDGAVVAAKARGTRALTRSEVAMAVRVRAIVLAEYLLAVQAAEALGALAHSRSVAHAVLIMR